MYLQLFSYCLLLYIMDYSFYWTHSFSFNYVEFIPNKPSPCDLTKSWFIFTLKDQVNSMRSELTRSTDSFKDVLGVWLETGWHPDKRTCFERVLSFWPQSPLFSFTHGAECFPPRAFRLWTSKLLTFWMSF